MYVEVWHFLMRVFSVIRQQSVARIGHAFERCNSLYSSHKATNFGV